MLRPYQSIFFCRIWLSSDFSKNSAQKHLFNGIFKTLEIRHSDASTSMDAEISRILTPGARNQSTNDKKIHFCDSPRREKGEKTNEAKCIVSRVHLRWEQPAGDRTVCSRFCSPPQFVLGAVFFTRAHQQFILFLPSISYTDYSCWHDKWKINESIACSNVRQRESVNRAKL